MDVGMDASGASFIVDRGFGLGSLLSAMRRSKARNAFSRSSCTFLRSMLERCEVG